MQSITDWFNFVAVVVTSYLTTRMVKMWRTPGARFLSFQDGSKVTTYITVIEILLSPPIY